jgi:hypothetical protein
MIYALYIEDPATGYQSVRTYSTAFFRALEVILLSPQPLILRLVDYSELAGEQVQIDTTITIRRSA